jgi:hypothetical protein
MEQPDGQSCRFTGKDIVEGPSEKIESTQPRRAKTIPLDWQSLVCNQQV